MKQTIGKIIEREADIMKTTRESGEDIIEFATPRRFMRRNQLIVGSANLFVELKVRCAAQTASLCVLVKNTADEERIVADVSAEQKCLLGRRALESNQHVRNVFVCVIVDLVRRFQLIRARKSFEQRADIIGEFSITDSSLLQDMSCEDVKIKLRRDPKMSAVAENRFDQTRMIENWVQHFCITQKFDQ